MTSQPPSRPSSRGSRKSHSRTKSRSPTPGGSDSLAGIKLRGGGTGPPAMDKSSSASVEPHDIPLPPSPPSSPSPKDPELLPSSSMSPQNAGPVADPVVKLTSDAIPNQTEAIKVEAANDPAQKGSSKNEVDKVHRVRIEPERTGWAKLYDLVRQVDKDRVEDIRDDIDTLLVFAGLFSAVITAFIIESYKNLQQQPEELTNQILMQLSNQITSLAINGNFINSTMPDFTSPSFQKPQYAVLVNILWFLSLVVALITASLGILVKQWFHELMSYETHDLKERLYLRFFRERGLETWKVFAIASALPLLLQLALLLFFIGLGLFLHQQDPVVAWITTGVMIMWLSAFLFTISMPMFSSQCPYKIPLLKMVYHWVRQISRESLSKLQQFCPWIWRHIGGRSQIKTVQDWFQGVLDVLTASEENKVAKDGTLALPVVLRVREVLRGERLNEALSECFGLGDVTHEDMEKTLQNISNNEAAMNPSALPGLLEEPEKVLDSFVHEAFHDDRLLLNLLCREGNPYLIAILYSRLSCSQSKLYDPSTNIPISSESLFAFVHLVQTNTTSAAFSVLTMYSIRHRTITDHPDSFDHLFEGLSDSDKLSHGIGDQFLSNLLTATKSLIHSIWDQPQDGSDDRKIGECVKAIRANADESDPVRSPDPIAFINVFAEVLIGLVPLDVVRGREGEIYEVMGELAGIVVKFDGSSWSQSRSKCVRWTYRFIHFLDLQHGHLGSKLRALGLTLSLSDGDKELFSIGFKQNLPLHSC